MSRMAFILSAALLVISFQDVSAQATLQLNKKFEGVLNEPLVRVAGYSAYATELFIQLKSREPLNVMAEVIGDGRVVSVLIEDPAGGRVALETFKPDQATAMVKALSITGKYKITVFSDKVGDFSVKAINPNAPANSNGAAQLLAEKIERLEKELETARQELKSLEKSGSK